MSVSAMFKYRGLSSEALGLGLAVCLFFVTSVVGFLYYNKDSILQDAEKDLKQFNYVFLKKAERIFDSANILLRITTDRLKDGQIITQYSEKELHDLLLSYVAGMTHIRALTVIDAQGFPIATTFTYPTTKPDLSKRPYFSYARDFKDHKMQINRPNRHAVNQKQWLINLTMRLETLEGDFLGVVVVSIIPEYFESFFKTLDLPNKMTISILNNENIVMAQHPNMENAIGRLFRYSTDIARASGKQLEVLRIPSSEKHYQGNLLMNCQKTEKNILFLCSSFEEAKILSKWREEAILISSLTLVLAVLLFFIFRMLAIEIAKREKAEFTLQEKAKELERSNADLAQFAYVASHDLKEPLRMVRSFLGLLVRDNQDKLDEHAREYIAFATHGAQRMDALINDLLQYSRIETEAVSATSVKANLLVEDAIRNLQMMIDETSGRIYCDDLPMIYVDSQQVIRLFQNLIANALKYRDENRSPVISIKGDVKEDFVTFSISDNGIGIPADCYERIFVIFQRLHNHEAFAGTGIGLAICKRIIERHNGEIWVTSEPGEGSCFYFTLPRKT